ncbi:sensor histidine kinase [Bacillus sp. NPDC077027]|uniref:sensor histidine kinase n=1 Tax=Bacillus sp. NPDC077027 TaxID=3390548 RepID=UPI003D02A75F
MNVLQIGFRIYILLWIGIAIHTTLSSYLSFAETALWLITAGTVISYGMFTHRRFLSGLDLSINVGTFIVLTCSGTSMILIGNNQLVSPMILAVLVAADYIFLSTVQMKRHLTNQLKDLTLAESQTNDLLIELRSKNHETARHLNALSISKEADYLQDWINQFAKYYPNIKGENAYLAGTLHTFFERADKAKIELNLDLQVPFSSLPFSKAEQVSLTGNLLENALDSAIEAKNYGNKGVIHVTTSIRSGLFLITCENSTKGMELHILDNLFQTFGHSTKGGDHQGMGTYILQQLIKKSNGTLDFTYRTPMFKLELKIPMAPQ